MLFGVIYEAQEKYKNAERYFLKAIETGSKESYKDSISLLHIYIKDNQLAKAHEWIETITKHNDIAYYFNQAYYLLYKAEGKIQGSTPLQRNLFRHARFTDISSK